MGILIFVFNFFPSICIHFCQMTLKLKALANFDVTKDERDGKVIVFSMFTKFKVRDVCEQVVWSLSSCKPGHGIAQLLSDSTDTFWQSDGPQPHCVTVQFHQKTQLVRLCLYTDYKVDESYTPSRLVCNFFLFYSKFYLCIYYYL